ncbi:MAG: ATPase, T2SS/T4P/T4SS family [Candidatus Omnitrophica bacterium]|nr:ATPase, T2SS/T4P/T4SS family [Candidatus Omnitrophota bacterium]
MASPRRIVYRQVGDILLEKGIITPEQLQAALAQQKKRDGFLGEVLISLGYATEEDIAACLAIQYGFSYVALGGVNIEPEIIKLIPAETARHFQIVPLYKMNDILTVAMADPLNVFAIDYLISLTGCKIESVIASAKDISNTISRFYSAAKSSANVIDDILKQIPAANIEVISAEKDKFAELKELTSADKEEPVVKITNAILIEAVKNKSSDVLIEPQENAIRVRFRMDGLMREQSSPERSVLPFLVSRIKVMANLDISEHRLPQEGRFKVKIGGTEIDFRVSIIPTASGESIVLRLLDKSQAIMDMQKLGFDNVTLSVLRNASYLPHGMILVCGPTGSGKTTTLYSILQYVNAPQKNIITVEDPIECQLEGINQVPARAEIGLTFASALRSILRQDPNIIMIGEIRDAETLDIAIKSALTGHLVLSTLHTNTAAGSVMRLLNMGAEPFLITASLVCILAQRLIRKICPYCKEQYQLKAEVARKLGLDSSNGPIILSRGKGCQSCYNSGYSGRVAIAEVISLTGAIREMILKGATEDAIKEKARQEGMKTLRENGMAHVLAGTTTLEEILRVTIGD